MSGKVRTPAVVGLLLLLVQFSRLKDRPYSWESVVKKTPALLTTITAANCDIGRVVVEPQ